MIEHVIDKVFMRSRRNM